MEHLSASDDSYICVYEDLNVVCSESYDVFCVL